MNRRAYLRGTAFAAAASMAGCTALSIPGMENENPPGSENGPEDGWKPLDSLPRVDDPTVVEFETERLTAAVSNPWFRTDDGITVQLDFVSPATDSQPAILQGVIANTRSFEQTVETRRLQIIDDPAYGRTDDRNGAYIAPTQDHPLAETTPIIHHHEGRWRVGTVQGSWYPETITIPAESGLVADYYFLGHHMHDETPIGPGYYRFTGRNELEIAVWSTDRPGPDVDSAFADTEPPALPDREPVHWFHEATPKTEITLEPETETVGAPGVIEFTFRNHSHEKAAGNPHYWRVYKLVDGLWYPVHPWAWTQPLVEIGPGGRDESKLAVFHGESIPCHGAREVGHLGGGTYAYEVGFAVEDETHAAMFELEAPDIEIEPESDATIDVEGTTAVVELPNHDGARHPVVVTVTAEPVDDVDRRFIPEQLPRRPFRPVRNALALFDGDIDTVHVRTDRATGLEIVGYDAEESIGIAYDGSTYRVSAEVEDA